MLEVGDRKFILYVPTRWLQCLPVIQRIVEQKIDKTKTDFINPLNVLLNDSIVVDRKTEEFIRELNNQDRILFFSQVKDFYQTCTQQLLHYLTLNYTILRCVRFLCPENKDYPNLEKWILTITKRHIIFDDEISVLRMEIRAYKLSRPCNNDDKNSEINHYWSSVCANERYPILGKLARFCLILPHGNAEVERLFSSMDVIITKKRQLLDEYSVKALLFCKSTLWTNECNFFKLPITQTLTNDKKCPGGISSAIRS